MTWSTETVGLVAAIIASLGYSLVKPASWTKESKEQLSFWLAVVASLVVAFYRKDVTTATLMVLVPTILGTMQIWYKFVAQNIGIEGITRGFKHAVETKVVDIVHGTGTKLNIAQEMRLEYSDKANKLSRDLLAGKLTAAEYNTAMTALNNEYQSVFPVS